MESHVMVAIETASASSDAALISIAAVEFNPNDRGAGNNFYEVVSLASSINAGGTMSPETIKWWMKQNPEVSQECWNNPNESDLESVLIDFNSWLSEFKDLVLWANPPSFDITIIESAMRRLKMKPCWYSSRLMDLRTLRILAWGIDRKKEAWEGDAIPDKKMQHNALYDATRQCAMAQQCLSKLNIEVL